MFTTKLVDLILPQVSKENDLDHLFIVMSHHEWDLRTFIKKQNNLTGDVIKVILYNALCALRYLHKANVFHRDIKPANILMDDMCQVFICDFGMSRNLPGTYKAARKFKQNAYEGVAKAQPKERKSREQQFEESMSKYLNANRVVADRDITCCVQTRVYRAPEVILTC